MMEGESSLLLLWLTEALSARKRSKCCPVYDINGRKMVAYSQQGQEAVIIKNFMPKINQVQDGTFVELGGYDGITYSNTKGFEDAFGFSGVLIEASDAYVAMDINRPNTQNFRAAISTEPKVTFFGSDATSGTLKNVLQNRQETDASEYVQKQLSGEPSTYEVTGRTMSSILKDSKIEYIDLFFIDVEGSEIDVIKTMNWDIPVYVICIEMHSQDSRSKEQEEIRKILKDRGFTYKTKVKSDEIWVNESYFRKEKFK